MRRVYLRLRAPAGSRGLSAYDAELLHPSRHPREAEGGLSCYTAVTHAATMDASAIHGSLPSWQGHVYDQGSVRGQLL